MDTDTDQQHVQHDKPYNLGSSGEDGRGHGVASSSPLEIPTATQQQCNISHMERYSSFGGGGSSGAFACNGVSVNSTRMLHNSASAGNGHGQYLNQRPSRGCTSPISSIVGTTLHQLNLKRSSSAPMINQLGTANDTTLSKAGITSSSNAMSASAQRFTSSTTVSAASSGGCPAGSKEQVETDASSLATSFLATFNNSGPRPRRFSASFSPGSPNPPPNRVHQLRHENTTDWETVSEKEFHGTSNIAQSWEDLSLESMSMEVASRRPSLSDQLWLSMPACSSASVSASSSPAASPRVLSRFSPSLSSPSPTRKSFTTRRSLSPIAVRPSVLSIGQGVKRKVDWDAGSSPMDCSPQPAKRAGGLLSFQCSNTSYPTSNPHSLYSASPFNTSFSAVPAISMITNHVEDSPNSFETESSVSSNGGRESPFFRPVDSPITVLPTPEDSPHPTQTEKL